MSNFEKVSVVFILIGSILIGVTGLLFFFDLLFKGLGFLFSHTMEIVFSAALVYLIILIVRKVRRDDFV